MLFAPDKPLDRFKDPHRSYLSVTHAGGTPNYMAPELFNGSRRAGGLGGAALHAACAQPGRSERRRARARAGPGPMQCLKAGPGTLSKPATRRPTCGRVDEAADVYSLGCILYECVARRQPFAHLAGGPEGSKTYNMLFKVGGGSGGVAGGAFSCSIARQVGARTMRMLS